MRIQRGGDVEQRPERIETTVMLGMFLSVVLHHARPINVRQQRRVFHTHDFEQSRRTEQQIVAFLMQCGALFVHADLQAPNGRQAQGHGEKQQRGCARLHLRFLWEKIIAAAAIKTTQYSAAYSVVCRIRAPGMATPCATGPVTLKFSKLGSR